tara:strand:+ start:80 stop:367 length:288 start_codon:yes stop_codon:yes gene_type:complete
VAGWATYFALEGVSVENSGEFFNSHWFTTSISQLALKDQEAPQLAHIHFGEYCGGFGWCTTKDFLHLGHSGKSLLPASSLSCVSHIKQNTELELS